MAHRHGPAIGARWGAARLVRDMILQVIPQVDRDLSKWAGVLERCPDPELRRQGLASMRHKRFHAIGGSVYGAYPRLRPALVSLIVAYQTISDYLDNLCDRSGIEDESAFRRLHASMLDALEPATPVEEERVGFASDRADYYALYPHGPDGGYLRALVAECRRHLFALPSYHAASAAVRRLAELYCELQVCKHVRKEDRVALLTGWFEREWRGPGDLYWWEFAAACGSTLGIFSLLNLAASPGCAWDLAARVSEAYFPWVCGLHILLDYLIDQGEDREGGDLNFVSFYPHPSEAEIRIGCFVDRALESVSVLPCAEFHAGVVRGLLALYLSDPKAEAGALRGVAVRLLERGGTDARLMWKACRHLRKAGLL